MLLTAGAGMACRSVRQAEAPTPLPITLPEWFTRPSSDSRHLVPVDLHIRLPDPLRPLADAYGQPDWVVYGVLRALGADAFLASGTFRHFVLSDDLGQSSVIEDTIVYDVDGAAVRRTLEHIARAAAEAETERDRRDVFGRHVYRRFGGYVLFGIEPRSADTANLLLTDGVARDPVEVFTPGASHNLPTIGWTETTTDYIETHAGSFSYANPFESFRRTEEEAIRELAKTLLMRFSHMSRDVGSTAAQSLESYREDVVREDIRLRLRGVRVLRRAVDPDRNLCLVQVAVSRDGVSRD